MRKMLAAVLTAIVVSSQSVAAGDRAAEWKEVETAMGKGLPKTAIEALDRIIPEALADGAHAEAVKAICRKIALQGNIEGNKPEEKIVRLQAEIETAPPAMKPVMEALLAEWYWQYFQQNRWRFTQRTQTAEAPGPDLQTWDLPRILAEIDRHFSAALADDTTLKATPISAFDGLLEKRAMPDNYRPTLFDFLAYEALQFYSAGEQGAVQAEDSFALAADGPVFASAAEFLKWTPETTDAESPTLKGIRLYQALLAFHRNDADPTAFADADLWRLNFGYNKATGEEKNERYKKALERFVDRWSEHEVSARALAYWAEVLYAEDEPSEARTMAQRGLDAFPKSAGADICFNLIKRIEARSARIQTERVWNDPPPNINVTYRNVERVFFRAVPYEFIHYLTSQRWSLYNFDDKARKKLLDRSAALEWSANLPPTTDFRERTETMPAPTGLKPGFYFIVASHDASFSEKENQVSVAPVWVSDLALVVRPRSRQGFVDGLVLEAGSGAPVAGAMVECWKRDREGWYKPVEETQSDKNGWFSFSNSESRSLLLVAEQGGRQLASADEYWVSQAQSERADHATVFFTDRSLYRPGQTIYYKGIHFRFDREKGEYHTVAGEEIEVQFLDPNGKEIEHARRRSNDYGSFDGAFTAPRDRVMGRMTIRHLNKGSTSFSVEEYKRPKFRVEVAAPKEAAKLNAEVTVSGKATAYTGAAIGGAKVKWRVVREVQWPVWWRWCCWGWWPPAGGESQAIAHGATATENDGSFVVKFVARPDPEVSAESEPTFAFHVYADVVDSTGETRSAEKTVRAGYTALKAAVEASEWETSETPVKLTVTTQSLDDEPQAATGTVKVYRLQEPDKVIRADLQQPYRRAGRNAFKPSPDPADPNSWELGKVAGEGAFATDEKGKAHLAMPLGPGIYRAMLETKDRFGKTVTARLPLTVVDSSATRFPIKLANHFAAPQWSVQPGEPFSALWGTGYGEGRAFVEIERGGKSLRRYWTRADRTQELVEQPVGEEMRGGFTLRVTYVRENRAYLNERVVDVPWSNKVLDVRWERFTSKLGPGQKETWTAVISRGKNGTMEEKSGTMEEWNSGKTNTPSFQPSSIPILPAAAEMVAGLYDASLDQYLPHDWIRAFSVFRREEKWTNAQFENRSLDFRHLVGWWRVESRGVGLSYRAFPGDIAANLWGYGYAGGRVMRAMAKDARGGDADGYAAYDMLAPAATAAPVKFRKDELARAEESNTPGLPSEANEAPPEPDLSKIAARKNLNETAFFFPHLLSGTDGVVRMEFTMPEALTEWKFLGFAHDRELRAGYLTGTTVTAKDLMVEPNPPRFVREGDTIEFTVKVSNQSAERQVGKVKLSLADARTLKEVNSEVRIQNSELMFDIAAKESKSFSWRMSIPDGMGFLTYKVVGAAGALSDGEEGYLPVLSRRILVQESLPLPIRGPQTKSFTFGRLLDSGKSDTLRQQSLTVQMVSQPAWYAVMALPYLMEYPYECSEQVFNRLYANALARHIANSDPKIRRIFDQWKGTQALDSPLEKNQDLKSVALEETPWVRQAEDESQARRSVGILFDANRLDEESARTLRKLTEMQISDGRWPWFPGGQPSEYITLYIVTGFGRLRNLGADVDVACAVKALSALDEWMDEQYRQILKEGHPDHNHLTHTVAFYLYGRSFFLSDRPIAREHREGMTYWMGQARRYWLDLACRQSQAHLAVALKRLGDGETALAIMKSIKERSVSNEEMGMFWRDLELSWWWYRAPIETQAMMIEAFAEVAGDAQAVEDCKVWLLKQKQTQDWKTTKATADAVYGLLLRGTNMLASDALVEVSLAGTWIEPEKVEAGTGFYEQRFARGEIVPAMGNIVVRKTDDGVSWGSVHWQYLEDMAKVTPYEGTPLKLRKTLFVKEATKKGQELKPVTGALAVGDELVVRIELRTDRDMEYVHLKDQRGSGTEPVNVLSRYKYQDGLAYYESTRDTASHFFIDYLPKGVYVFEYSTRVQLKGKYQTGVASIECMYAPEFNSHSESMVLTVE